MTPEREELEISDLLMKAITNFQDTVHDTAISYHRKLREQAVTKSELDNIPGIGEAKKKILLKHFGSVEKVIIIKAKKNTISLVKIMRMTVYLIYRNR